MTFVAYLKSKHPGARLDLKREKHIHHGRRQHYGVESSRFGDEAVAVRGGIDVRSLIDTENNKNAPTTICTTVACAAFFASSRAPVERVYDLSGEMSQRGSQQEGESGGKAQFSYTLSPTPHRASSAKSRPLRSMRALDASPTPHTAPSACPSPATASLHRALGVRRLPEHWDDPERSSALSYSAAPRLRPSYTTHLVRTIVAATPRRLLAFFALPARRHHLYARWIAALQLGSRGRTPTASAGIKLRTGGLPQDCSRSADCLFLIPYSLIFP
ncbi:hypothetical protein DFH09DRAFT_1088487 [Mycena vulgaris]|nr:hypothetical protein DFH09DRAFT_1088487 [Mycena vulgaris]